jgi:hypothetical protein
MYKFGNRKNNINIDNYSDSVVLNALDQDQINDFPKNIWIYWDGEIPTLVKECIDRVKTLNPNYSVNILNSENISLYIKSDYTLQKKITPQHKADLIRLELMYIYGGIWLDASIILYENLDWIENLINTNKTKAFAYYREGNTTVKDFPVIENWLLASHKNNLFFKHWHDEFLLAIKMGAKKYNAKIGFEFENSNEYFQKIGNINYLLSYVVCQKIMRIDYPSITLINCDKNALYYQVSNRWMKEKVLIDLALNYKPEVPPKLIKICRKERLILNKYYLKEKYFEDSLLNI